MSTTTITPAPYCPHCGASGGYSTIIDDRCEWTDCEHCAGTGEIAAARATVPFAEIVVPIVERIEEVVISRAIDDRGYDMSCDAVRREVMDLARQAKEAALRVAQNGEELTESEIYDESEYCRGWNVPGDVHTAFEMLVAMGLEDESTGYGDSIYDAAVSAINNECGRMVNEFATAIATIVRDELDELNVLAGWPLLGEDQGAETAMDTARWALESGAAYELAATLDGEHVEAARIARAAVQGYRYGGGDALAMYPTDQCGEFLYVGKDATLKVCPRADDTVSLARALREEADAA